MDGFEVCKRVKEGSSTKNVKILIMTGQGTKTNMDKALSIGADAFINKPSSKQEIITCVEKLLKSKWRTPLGALSSAKNNIRKKMTGIMNQAVKAIMVKGWIIIDYMNDSLHRVKEIWTWIQAPSIVLQKIDMERIVNIIK